MCTTIVNQSCAQKFIQLLGATSNFYMQLILWKIFFFFFEDMENQLLKMKFVHNLWNFRAKNIILLFYFLYEIHDHLFAIK